MPATTEITQVGSREDLGDIIAVADMKSTPFTSRVTKGTKPTNMLFEFQMDSYAAAKAGGVPDGRDVQVYENKAANRKRAGARCEVFERAPMVGFIAEEVQNVAGVGASEFARAKAKSVVEIKRDMETELLSIQESVADDGVTGSKTRGLGKWLQATAQSDQPVDAAFLTPSASIYSSTAATFDEADLRALLQSRYEQTGASANLVCFAGTQIRNAITDFSRYTPDKASNLAVQRFTGTSGKRFENSVDIYAGDFGSVEVVTDLFLPTQYYAYIVDMDFVELRTHTAPNFKPLPDLGGGPRGLIRAIVGLAVTNPLAHCKIAAS